MPVSYLSVSRNGQPISGAKVVLEWKDFVYLGKSKPVYTSGNGIATIEHFYTGSAIVYVDEKKNGKMATPGSKTVRI